MPKIQRRGMRGLLLVWRFSRDAACVRCYFLSICFFFLLFIYWRRLTGVDIRIAGNTRVSCKLLLSFFFRNIIAPNFYMEISKLVISKFLIDPNFTY